MKGGAMKIYRSLLYLVIFIFAAGVVSAADTPVMTKEVVYYKNDKNVSGYLARPDDDQKHPGIILIHEWWGLNDNIRDNAKRFAKLGYVALAVDLYDGKSSTTPGEARKLATAVRQNVEEAFKNLKSALDYLKTQPSVDSNRLASIGWCFGGGWSYQMAKNNLGTKASIIYYGFFNPKDDLSKMRATILGHFGENDRAIKVDSVQEFQVNLKTLSGNHEVYIYENAGHAFANEGGSRYNQEAADLAWKRTVTFLEKNL
jgi:carboxymethylenebutenolidase